MSDAVSQRVYQSPCPHCGAPVVFHSAASPMAVCSFCRSTLLREGQDLRLIGQVSAVFDDHSPLQLGVQGQFKGVGFVLVGRIQFRYAQGYWNEWHAYFEDGRSGWLSEDNGQFVFSFDQPAPGVLPSSAALQAGQPVRIGLQSWSVGSITLAHIHTAQGELPKALIELTHTAQNKPPTAIQVVDLRNTQGEVATFDNRPLSETQKASWSVGRLVQLADLKLSGLKTEVEQALRAQALECPNCGAALEAKLSSTQSIVCSQCRSVIDISQGIGADLAYYTQDTPDSNIIELTLPLGKIGRLTLTGKSLTWQVIGYVERCEIDPAEDDGWQSTWREYLLYNRQAGFLFLIEAEDGWSWSRPLTGVPQRRASGQVELDGVRYQPLYSYNGKITYVLGEFYWRLERDLITLNTDYKGLGRQARVKRLSCERTAHQGDREVVWSAGEQLEAETLAKAFNLSDKQFKTLSTWSLGRYLTWSGTWAWLREHWWSILFIIFLIFFLTHCTHTDHCAEIEQTYGIDSPEYQSCRQSGHHRGGYWGGSYGGYSTGGSHK